ncbi:MAG: polyprenyl synthetase family protein [Bacillota bacterium]|nr:polyprenyl synthetase family protein [Bacillota bacterium]
MTKQLISQEINTKKSIQEMTNGKLSLACAIPELKEVETNLIKVISSNGSTTSEIGNHLVLAGGKKLRPLLTILSGNCFNSCKKKLITAGTSIELIHLASLVHDDIIDKASTRRGQASVNAKWGDKNAVLMGDFLFAKAFDLLSRAQLYQTLQLVVYCIQEMCDGEIEQDKFKYKSKQSLSDYYSRIRQKTALLIAACCQTGAIIGEASLGEVQAFKEYGLNLGYAFQIVDDVLDFTSKEEVLGKPCGSDLAHGNLTLPVLLLLQDNRWGPWVAKQIEAKKLSGEVISKIHELLHTTGTINASLARAIVHINRAKASLTTLAPSPYKGILESMADMVVTRSY